MSDFATQQELKDAVTAVAQATSGVNTALIAVTVALIEAHQIDLAKFQTSLAECAAMIDHQNRSEVSKTIAQAIFDAIGAELIEIRRNRAGR